MTHAWRVIGKRRAGFGVAPILYMLGLIGIGAGILFSSYSQTIKTNISMTNSLGVKNDLDGAATTLAATSVLGANDPSVLCPPQGGIDGAGTNCVNAPSKMIEFYPTANISGDAHLPGNYTATSAAGSPTEVGVFSANAGIKQLDPWGHYYIYCRWENAAQSTAEPAFTLISAGPDGILQTNCAAATACNVTAGCDDLIISVNAATAVNRAAVWQTGTSSGTSDVFYGTTGHQLSVDANGNLFVPGTITADGTYSGAAISGTTISGSSGVFSGPVSGTTGAFSSTIVGSSSITASGDLYANGNLFYTSSGGAVNAANGAFTVDSTGNVTTTIGSASFGGALSTAGTFNATGAASLGSSLTTIGLVRIGTNTVASGSASPLLTVGQKISNTYPFSVDQYGNVVSTGGGSSLGGGFSGSFSGSVAGTTVSASSGLTAVGLTSITGSIGTWSTTGDITTAGTITATNFVGGITIGSGGGGVTLSGVLPIANGGTAANNATSAIANLTNSVTNTIPAAALVNNSIGTSQLANSGVGAGTYNNVTVDTTGRVISGFVTNYSSPTITDGGGDSVTVGTGGVIITVGSSTQGLWTTTGLMIGNANAPKNRLDVYGATAIGTPYAGVYTAPTDGLIVAGSTGIGTSSPVSALQVVGTVTATNFSGSGAGLTNIGTGSISGTVGTGNGGTGTSTTFTPGSIVFAGSSGIYNQDNAQFFWDDTNHRLGIATATPTTALQIALNSTSSNGAFDLGDNTNTSNLLSVNQRAYFGYDSGGNAVIQGASGNGIHLNVNNATFASGTAVAIATSGNVGIGSTAPLTSLDLSQKSDAIALPVGNTAARPTGTALTNGEIRYNSSTPGIEAYINNAWSSLVATGTSGLGSGVVLGTSASATNPSRLNEVSTGLYSANSGEVDIASTGNQIAQFTGSGLNVPIGSVGIGTTVPSDTLHVYGGNVRVDGTHGFLITGVGLLGILNGTLSLTNSSSTTDITIAPNSTDRLHVVASTGKVGIGSSSPIVALDLSQKNDAIALPVGNTAARPTGTNVANGEIRYNSSTPGVEAYINGAWSTLQSIGTTSGLLGVSNGGTGDSTLTAHGVLVGEGTAAVAVTSAGTTGYLLTGGGASADPTFAQLNLGTSAAITGTLGTVNGGLGGNFSASTGALSINAGTVTAGTLSISNGGTGQTTAATARASSGLDIDEMTTVGDAAYTILSTDRTVATSATLTAARIWTLPAASSINPGQQICVVDKTGGVTSTNTITITRAGTDTINGATTYALNTAYQGACLISDGTSKWSTGATAGSITGSGTTNYVARWTPNGTTLGTGEIVDIGTGVGIGTTVPGYLLDVENTATGAGNAIYGSNTGASNNGAGVYGNNTSIAGAGVYGYAAGSGVAGHGSYGVNGLSISASGVGVLGTINITNNNGYAVYGTNSGVTNTGYAGYFNNNSSTGWGVYSAGTSPSYFGGNVGIGTTSPIVSLDLSQKTDAIALPVGNTAARPTGTAVANGEIRYNSSTPGVEAYINGAWSTLQSIGTTSGLLGVSNGGTGDSTLTAHGVLVGEGTAAVNVTSAGTTGYLLTSGGASADPAFAQLNLGTSAAITGTLPVTNGGTGTATQFTPGSIVFAGTSGLYTQNNSYLFWDNTNNRLGIGTTVPTHKLTVAGNIDLVGTTGVLTEIANDTSTGTTQYKLAKITTAGAAVATGTSDTDGIVGVVVSSTAASGNAQIAVDGQANCTFDGATTTGDYVVNSTTVIGDCHDAGTTRSASSQNIGRVLTANSGAGTTATVDLALAPSAASSGAVTGTGTTNYVAKWTSSTALGTGEIVDIGTGVGIGTTSPGGKIQINSSATSSEIILAKNSLGNTIMDVEEASSSSGIITLRNSSGITGIYLHPAASSYFTGGFVGIGTSSPAALLHLSGSQSAAAWTSNGIGIRQDAATYTDTTSVGTVSANYVNVIGAPTLAASSATTYTSAATLYVQGPVTGTNVSLGGNASNNGGGFAIASNGSLNFSGSNNAFSSLTSLGVLDVGQAITTGLLSTSYGRLLKVNGPTITDNTSTGTVAARIASSFAAPTFAASGTETITNAATVYVAGAPSAGTNVTITNPLALDIVGGNSYFGGDIGVGIVPAASLHIAQNQSAPFWNINGIGIRQDAATYTDTTSSGALGGNIAINGLAGGTIAASSAVTYPNASTLYVGAAPVAGTNVTFGNTAWSLFVNGAGRFNGFSTFGGANSVPSVVTVSAGTNGLSATSWTTTGLLLSAASGILTDTSGSGTIATRTASSFAAPTFAASGTQTITNAATVYVAAPPNAGTNSTVTNTSALYIPGGAITGSPTNSYGLNVTASTGATNNYAAIFQGGNVGIGTTNPGVLLDVNGVSRTNSMSIGGAASPSGKLTVTYDNSILGQASTTATIDSADNTSATNALAIRAKIGSGSATNLVIFRGDGLVGIGTTSPIVSLDLSQKTDAIALPVGNTAARPTGTAVANGEIRYNSSTPGVEAYINGAWSTLQSIGTTSGLLGVSNGGTGDSTLTAHGVLVGEGTAAVNVTSAGTAGYILTSGGASTDPTFAQLNLGTSAAITGALPIANGGTGQTTAATARASSGLDIDEMTTVGDAAYTILSTDRTVATSATLTAARIWTLPAASSINPGQQICVVDKTGGVTSTNTITITRAGTDTINGATTYALNTAYQGACLISDGTSKWSTGATAGSITGSGTTNYVARWTPNGTTLGTGTLYDNGTSVGIGTASPQATLDVYGYAKLKMNASLPVACSATTQGSLALTHTARTCVCDATNTWSDTVSGTACVW